MNKKIVGIVLALIVVIAAAGGTYLVLQKRLVGEVEKTAQEAVTSERTQWQQKTRELEEKLASLEQDIKAQEPVINEEKIQEAFGGVAADTAEDAPEAAGTREKIDNFFRYLDEQGYLEARGINEPASVHFEKMLGKLKQSAPVITGETQDLFTLLKNITYFFRILGKTDVLLVKDILVGEADILEPTMELFFKWLDPWAISENQEAVALPPATMYEYAGFMLHTIAGQSYLFRRDSRVRCLTTYYCLLILDRANRTDLNQYGIDIRPHIDSLSNEMESQTRLAGRKGYLRELPVIPWRILRLWGP